MRGLLSVFAATLAVFAAGSPLPATVDVEPRQSNNFVGYLISTFSDPRPQVQMHLSNGADLSSWRFLNGGQPVLASNVGTRGVRDIYLVTNTARSQYFLIATGPSPLKPPLSSFYDI